MQSENERKERRFQSESHGRRNEFERDRDRVLYTESFRRLSGVSQVAYTGEAELYHDRLSHSLKVGQVGRRIAQFLKSQIENENIEVSLSPEVVETAALIHDIGHPPFGHPAEQKLDQLIKRKGVSEGFEGNAQSLRIITRVAVHPETEQSSTSGATNSGERKRGATETSDMPENIDRSNKTSRQDNPTLSDTGIHSKERGLNLTRASINASIKYPWKRSIEQDANEWGEDESQKFGRYRTEKDIFSWARQGYDTKHRCLEAEIMDWADDLVYAVHDVEDFYRAGVIPLEQILTEHSAEREEFINDYLPDDTDQESQPNGKFEKREQVNDWLTKIYDISEISRKFRGTRKDRVQINRLSGDLIGRFVGDTDDQDDVLEIQMNPERGDRYLQIDSDLRKEVTVLKHMLKKYVLENPALQAQRRGEKQLIEDLFGILYNAVRPQGDEQVDIIHPPFREDAKKLQKSGTARTRARLVTDVITFMTEQQAIKFHKRLTGNTPGTLQEYIVT